MSPNETGRPTSGRPSDNPQSPGQSTVNSFVCPGCKQAWPTTERKAFFAHRPFECHKARWAAQDAASKKKGKRVKSANPDRFIDKHHGLLVAQLSDVVEKDGPLAVDGTGTLYRYADGVWQPDGEREVRARVVRLLGDRYRMAHAANIIDRFKAQPPKWAEMGEDKTYLNLPNGLLDWRTGDLLPHNPDIASAIRIPIEWDPDARCPQIEAWMGEVFPADAREFVEEVVGYALYNDNPLHKAVLLFGRGRNGKGTFLRLLKALVGQANVSSVTPQSLDDNRFRAAELHGKLANLVGDVDPRIFKATETFKQITGGDLVTVERKYGQPFAFYCRALMVAAFNRMPRTADTTEGFFSRWVVLPFVGYFPPGVADPSREDKMHDEAELRGLLALAVRGLRRLMARGRFCEPQSVQDATETYRKAADPVRAFLDGYMPLTEWQPSTEVYKAYEAWAQSEGHQVMSAGQFRERLEEAGSDNGTPHFVTPRKRNGVRGYKFVPNQGAQGAEGASHATPGRVYGGKGAEDAPSAPSAPDLFTSTPPAAADPSRRTGGAA